MKKLTLVLMLTLSAGLIVSCGSEGESSEDTAEQKADKDSEKDKKCDKDSKCCKKKGKICDSRKALEDAMSDEEKATIADARTKIKEVMGEDMYMMMSNHMCDRGGKCCKSGKGGKCCKKGDKDHASEDGDEAKEGKKCEHKDGKKCCKHGMMGMMKDMDPEEMQAKHDSLMPTIESLVAIADAHPDHFEELESMHAKKMEHMEEHMGDHHHADSTKAMSDEMKEIHDKMHSPEHMKQMMIVHYLLMNPAECKMGKCEKKKEKSE